MRTPRSAAVLLGAGMAVLVTVPVLLPSSTPHAAAATGAAPGVVLPNGRLVTPAGSPYDAHREAGDASYDLGDFPLDVAVSPASVPAADRIAVTSLDGRGEGQPHGFNSFCEQDQYKAGYSCPGVPKQDTENPKLTAPDEGLDVVSLATGKAVQVVAVPTNNSLPQQTHSACPTFDGTAKAASAQGFNCFGYGVAFSPDGKHLYASGGGSDCIYDYSVSGTTLTLHAAVPIPSPATKVPAEPVIGGSAGWPRAVAVSSDGKHLAVVDEFDSTLETFDLTSGTPVLTAQVLVGTGVPGSFPVAYLRDVLFSPQPDALGDYRIYLDAEGTSTVYEYDLDAVNAVGAVTASGPIPAPKPTVTLPLTGVNHPNGMALTPDGSKLLVTGTDSDTLGVVPVVNGLLTTDVNGITDVRIETVPRPSNEYGSSPTAVAVGGDSTKGYTAYVADAGDDDVAVVDLSSVTPTVQGFIPTGWYPTGVTVGPDGRIYTVAAKGLGSRYVAGIGGYTPAPGTSLPSGASLPTSSYYDAENMPGLLSRVTPPSDALLSSYTATAQSDILHAGGLDQRPAHSPIPAAVGQPSPITHVVYIVRENRTFDQVLGDLALKRKDVDADPADQVLAPATPNAHAVAGRYAIADHFFSDGEASIQGHWWTSSADVNDYVEQSWRQYYSPRGRPSDSAILPITSAPGCSIFQKLTAYQETHPTFTFKNFGELVGAAEPNTSLGQPGYNLCQDGLPVSPGSNPVQDPNYPSETQLVPDDRTRAAEFLKNSGLSMDGQPLDNGNALADFNYLILSEDHTSGLAGTYTPRSEVAQNDAALGEILHGLSESSYWSSTAVFVVEDDSQDGIDHVDGHRNVLLVASPYAKQTSGDGCEAGYVGHAHYDQTSVLRTAELILGVSPISAYDAGATPLYDLFQPIDSASQLTKADLAPFPVQKAPPFIDETVASLPKTSKNSALVAYSKTLNTKKPDVSEAGLEDVLWQTVRTDPVPEQLAADAAEAPQKVAGVTVPGTDPGETASARADARNTALDLEPAEVRPGTPPTLSTTTGQPVAAGSKAGCAKSPLPTTYPVAPGQTSLPGRTVSATEASTTPALAATGGRVWPAWLGLGLLLVAAGAIRWAAERRAIMER